MFFHGFHLISTLFPPYFLKSHFFLCFSMVFTLFPPYFHLISRLFPGYFQNLTVSCVFPWFSPYFHLISTLFPGYFQVISKISLFPVFSMVFTLFPPYSQDISQILLFLVVFFPFCFLIDLFVFNLWTLIQYHSLEEPASLASVTVRLIIQLCIFGKPGDQWQTVWRKSRTRLPILYLYVHVTVFLFGCFIFSLFA